MNKSQLIEKMSETFQFENINMIDHGNMVRIAYRKIISQLETKEGQYDLPDILIDLYDLLKNSLFDYSITDEYQIYHDCGKPFCLNIDENGKRHYPNHAEKSYEIWMNLEDNSSNKELIANLMKHDMDFHMKRGDELDQLWKMDIAPTLYFTAWAEIFANAEMFGGFDSDSFKIKKKRLISAGKRYYSIKKEI